MNGYENKKGITLIALVITIIILLILAGISIASLTGENGLLTKAVNAKEQSKISEYYEKIELIRTEIRLSKENYAPPTLVELQEEFDKNQKEWVASTEIKIIDGMETLELITKEGYIFHITTTDTKFKGKDKIIDTSDLEKEDILELKIVSDYSGGKVVKITDLSGKNYYQIEYQIDLEEGNWAPIESGKTVEVPYGATISARLVYHTNKGKIIRLKIEEIDPKVNAKNIDTSNYIRKTPMAFADLFEITWGSDGNGQVEYSILGNLNFNHQCFSNDEIRNIADLEIGTYQITCKITSPSGKTATATKENVKVTTLAPTSVQNKDNQNVEAYAIYSEYDLAYFRDLVNGGQFTINGKLMNHINLNKVCSAQIGNWTPIGNWNSTQQLSNGVKDLTIYYNGIFDGMGYQIENLYINDVNYYRQGLFSAVMSDGFIKNLEIFGNINGKRTLGRNLWN